MVVIPGGTERPVTGSEFIVTVNDAGFMVVAPAVVFVIEIASTPLNVWGVETVTVPLSVLPDGRVVFVDGEVVIVTS